METYLDECNGPFYPFLIHEQDWLLWIRGGKLSNFNQQSKTGQEAHNIVDVILDCRVSGFIQGYVAASAVYKLECPQKRMELEGRHIEG